MTFQPTHPTPARFESADEKKPYMPPTLIEYGDINEVTKDALPDLVLNGSVAVTTV